MKRYLILLATVLLVLGILSGCAEVRLANTQAVSWQVTPETQQESGRSVGVDSTFLLTLDGKLDEDQVRSCLQIEPAVEYQLQQEDSVWELTPEEELKSGKVYAFQVKDRLGQVQQSFAFQTQAQLEVSSTYPEDGAKYVEPNSGIEITFNRRIQEGAEEHFQIEPAVQGKFEYSGETLVFYPTEEMKDGQIYTVTISRGVQSLGDEQLREDYRFSFRVGDRKDNENALYLYQDKLETFLPNDPLVAVIRSEIKDVQTLDATIYRFDSIEDYIAAVQQHQEQMGETGWYEADTCRLDLGQLKAQQVFSSQLTPYINQNNSWKMYALLPNNLPQGWYLVDLENADRPQDWVQKFVQIGNVSVYTQAVNGSVLIWLNDAETGQPLVQKTVELRDIRTGKTVQGQTDQQGLVTLETGEMGQSYLTVLEDGKKIHFQEVELREEVEIPVDERYYGVLYTDRTVYRASDTIHFWGNVYPRHESDPMPKTVTANLEGLYRQEVVVDSEGFFTGELPFYSMEKGAYTLWIEDAEGGIYQSEYLQIGNYVKPAYILSVEPEKEYYALDEQLTFLVSAQYFDGTPVRGGRVRAESYYLDIPDEYITLDDEGKGKVTATVIPREYALSWRGSSADLVVSSADEQNVEVQARCDVDLVTSRYGVSTEPQGQDLVIHAGTLDPQRLFEEVPDGEELFDRCVAPGAVEMTLQLERSRYEDEVIGTYYDPINKETVYNTRYERKTEQLDSRELTVDGTLVLEDYFPQEEDGVTVTYSIRLDGGYGQQIVVSGSAEQISREWWNTVYNFIPRTDNDDWPPDSVSMGQEIPLGIYRNDIQQENTGRVLSYLLWADQMDQMGRSTVPHLEILAYTVHCGQRLQESEASFSYTCNGEKQEVSLGSLGQKSLRFSYDDFQNISFKQETGTVYACVNYTTDQLLEQSGENLVSIRKVVTPVEEDNGVGKATKVELIINFEEDAPLGYYTVSDSIPSGMRLMTYQKNEEDYRSVWIENENQQITAQIYRDTPRDETEEEQQKWKERRIVYYISGVLPGEYVVESACLSNPADEIFVSTDRQTIMVEP